MSLIFHTVNKMIFAMQGKYTASHSNLSKIHTCMRGHTLITKSLQSALYLATAYRFPFPSVSHRTTCTLDSMDCCFY